jgi:hypothetical protein
VGQRRRFLILPLQAGTTGAAGTTTRNTASIATSTANLFKFNDNDHITSKNPDRIVVALRKLPVPVYQTKRSIPNPLICVQSSSLPLKQDLTKQSCANLVKRIRNPLGVRSVMPVRDDTLNNRQRSMLAAASQSDWTVPENLHVVSSFSMRTLLLEDVWRLAPGTPVNVFSCLRGGPTRNPRFEEQWLKAHTVTNQGLPNLKGPGKGVSFRQVQGYVSANPRQHDILGRPVTDLVEIVTNTFQREGIIVRCPAGPVGNDYDLLLTFHELFFYPMCVFLQADLPYSSQWRSALQVQGGIDRQKLLLHRYIQEAGVDRTLLADALQQWQTHPHTE